MDKATSSMKEKRKRSFEWELWVPDALKACLGQP